MARWKNPQDSSQEYQEPKPIIGIHTRAGKGSNNLAVKVVGGLRTSETNVNFAHGFVPFRELDCLLDCCRQWWSVGTGGLKEWASPSRRSRPLVLAMSDDDRFDLVLEYRKKLIGGERTADDEAEIVRDVVSGVIVSN